MDKLLRAIYFANEKHSGQTRKDGTTPVILHLLSVAILINKVSKDDDLQVAGILHDTLEDTNTTFSEIEKKFNAKIARIVDDCTEKDRAEGWENRWKERKDKVLKHIKDLSPEAGLIKSADMLSNIYEMLKNSKVHGQKFLDSFHTSAIEKIIYNKKLLPELRKYHNNTLLDDIEKYLADLELLIKRKNYK